jgi:hypothetical protein
MEHHFQHVNGHFLASVEQKEFQNYELQNYLKELVHHLFLHLKYRSLLFFLLFFSFLMHYVLNFLRLNSINDLEIIKRP